jgi:hypothetical protein
MQGPSAKAAPRRRIAIGVVGVLVGPGLVLVGVKTTMWLGEAGFALMVASMAFAVTPVRPRAAAPPWVPAFVRGIVGTRDLRRSGGDQGP